MVTPQHFRERVARLRSEWESTHASPEWQQRNQEAAHDAAAHARWVARDRLVSLGIPLIHVEDILGDKWQPTAIDGQLHAFDAGSRSVLILAGGVGTMKTYSACKWLAAHGGRFIHATDMAHASTFDGDWGATKGASHLVIDDIGTEIASKSEWVIGKVREVLEHRVANKLPTVLTTNLTKPNFVSRYGDEGGRLIDRLKMAANWYDVPVFASQRKASP